MLGLVIYVWVEDRKTLSILKQELLRDAAPYFGEQ